MHTESVQNFTGFPSPAEEYKKAPLNLHSLLVRNPLSTFFVSFRGDAMIGENIFDQDLLVIERLPEYKQGDIVLAFVEGQRLVRKLDKENDRWVLSPANKGYRHIELTEEIRIFGRVLHSITHHFRISQWLSIVN